MSRIFSSQPEILNYNHKLVDQMPGCWECYPLGIVAKIEGSMGQARTWIVNGRTDAHSGSHLGE